MSQLLLRLEREATVAADPVERAVIDARIAIALSRLGKFQEARRCIDQLRSLYGRGQHGRVTVWIMLAESLLHYYADLDQRALDRVTRAQFLGLAIRDNEFVAIASAWKAHIEFEASKFPAMVQSLSVASANTSPTNSDANTRIAMVLSNCFDICGDHDEAQRWFKAGHRQAVIGEDLASVEALVYNRAAFRLARLRAENCTEAVESTRLRACRSDVESVKNLQGLTGIVALDQHIHLWDARLSIMEQKYQDAIIKLKKIRHSAPFAKYNFRQEIIDLEIAYCTLQDGCDAVDTGSILENFDGLDLDDKMVAAWMAGIVSRKLRSAAGAMQWDQRFISLRSEYEKMCVDLAQDLKQFAQK